ncbi:SC15 protein [Schizophyllum commune H4-8]|uniref:SC15 protein n=2 Tax=Schizophyllum commune TaxID=5334 RepID=D8Q5T0_SCHCM|nr:SC15 protein [Schizophyllum commune H4-8]KAI5892047.1 SC15 protein [Schizophyllum commune H4-8]CAA07544.1 ORF15 protein [Schizophyllum commune]
MYAQRLVTFFLFFLTLGLFTVAAPAEAQTGVAKRQDADGLTQIFTDLKDATGSILPQLETVADSGDAKDEDVLALVQQLLDSLNTANDGIEELKGKPAGGHPPKPDVLAGLIAEILKDVLKVLHVVLVKLGLAIPGLSPLLIAIDAALANILHGVEFLLAGVLKLVAGLLKDVAGLLYDLSFGLLLAALGF